LCPCCGEVDRELSDEERKGQQGLFEKRDPLEEDGRAKSEAKKGREAKKSKFAKLKERAASSAENSPVPDGDIEMANPMLAKEE